MMRDSHNAYNSIKIERPKVNVSRKIKRSLNVFLGVGFLLGAAGCGIPEGGTSPAAQEAEPMATYAPTPTQALVNLDGKLFFDMNATGLQDDVTYLPCLNQNCEAVTEPEPGLEGFEVCTDLDEIAYCATTGADGSFSISLPAEKDEVVYVSITDPHKNVPEKAMRFINLFMGEVFIPSYTLKGKVGLNRVDGKKVEGVLDPFAFYQGDVQEQRLYDTELEKITEKITLKIGAENSIGLMNERMVYPFRFEDFAGLDKRGGFDQDLDKGKVIDFAGNTQKTNWAYLDCIFDKSSDSPFLCTLDGHTALDYGYKGSPKGVAVFAAQEGHVNILFDEPNNAFSLYLYPSHEFNLDENPENEILLYYYHLDSSVVEIGQEVYRGQLLGFMGNRATVKEYPHLHFAALYGKPLDAPNKDMERFFSLYLKDFYANRVPENIVKGFNDHSIWTVWNQPVFYPINYSD